MQQRRMRGRDTKYNKCDFIKINDLIVMELDVPMISEKKNPK
jgi:hypothetical protein